MREVFNRRLYGYIDGTLLAAILVLSSIGLFMIYSATYDPTLEHAGPQVIRQFGALVLGSLGLVVLVMFDYRTLLNHSVLLYIGLVGLLIYTLFFGVERGGAQRWIDFGFINLQVSEFARVVLALTLAAFYSDQRRENRSFLDWVLGALIVSVPFVLIVREPDLGTAITLLPVAIIIMVFSGLKLKLLMSLCLVGILLTPLAWAYALEDYQKVRIASFIDPEQDPYGAGYQQIQARITVGSGGLEGKGFLEGTQNQYNFLPVAHNDFIFSVNIGEETKSRTNLSDLNTSRINIINIEKSIKLGQEISGHLVYGHVDCVTKILKIEKLASSWTFEFEKKQTDKKMNKFIVEKGSIAINGISLTDASLTANSFFISIISHTFENTNLNKAKENDLVNIEFDALARYVVKNG